MLTAATNVIVKPIDPDNAVGLNRFFCGSGRLCTCVASDLLAAKLRLVGRVAAILTSLLDPDIDRGLQTSVRVCRGCMIFAQTITFIPSPTASRVDCPSSYHLSLLLLDVDFAATALFVALLQGRTTVLLLPQFWTRHVAR